MLRVAVGVVVCPAGKVLIALRSAKQHAGGLWEFPGGKIDPLESTSDALRRELWEEVGIHVRRSRPLIKIQHDYPDKSVLLDVLSVDVFEGEAYGREGQQIAWVSPDELHRYQFPDANVPILKALALPTMVAVTGAFASFYDFEYRIRRSVARGARAVYLRLAKDCQVNREQLCRSAESLCASLGVRLLVNSWLLPCLDGPAGLHLTAAELSGRITWQRDRVLSLGASCHSKEQIDRAVGAGADYVFLSPVFQTDSHPDCEALGLERFGRMAERSPVPVYALGGVSPLHINSVRSHHGFGIAAIRSFWN